MQTKMDSLSYRDLFSNPAESLLNKLAESHNKAGLHYTNWICIYQLELKNSFDVTLAKENKVL